METKERRQRSRDGQARALLEAPPADTLKGKRDRAILATFLHHGLRCEELCSLRVRDLQPIFRTF
jgi:site-specific recombinase XerD